MARIRGRGISDTGGRGRGRGRGRGAVAGAGAEPTPLTDTGPSRGASASVKRTRPTALARRRDVAGLEPQIEETQHMEEIYVAAKGVAAPARSFPGGPKDTSILTHFGDHVTTRIWSRQDRGSLKLVTGGRKLKEIQITHREIQERVNMSGLAPLYSSCYQEVDRGLLCAFVERWHPETSTFHLPVGEMIVTLNDVSSLLHLPIVGAFWTHPEGERDVAHQLMTSLLGVSEVEAREETDTARGPRVRLLWLRTLYRRRCEEQ